MSYYRTSPTSPTSPRRGGLNRLAREQARAAAVQRCVDQIDQIGTGITPYVEQFSSGLYKELAQSQKEGRRARTGTQLADALWPRQPFQLSPSSTYGGYSSFGGGGGTGYGAGMGQAYGGFGTGYGAATGGMRRSRSYDQNLYSSYDQNLYSRSYDQAQNGMDGMNTGMSAGLNYQGSMAPTIETPYGGSALTTLAGGLAAAGPALDIQYGTSPTDIAAAAASGSLLPSFSRSTSRGQGAAGQSGVGAVSLPVDPALIPTDVPQIASPFPTSSGVFGGPASTGMSTRSTRSTRSTGAGGMASMGGGYGGYGGASRVRSQGLVGGAGMGSSPRSRSRRAASLTGAGGFGAGSSAGLTGGYQAGAGVDTGFAGGVAPSVGFGGMSPQVGYNTNYGANYGANFGAPAPRSPSGRSRTGTSARSRGLSSFGGVPATGAAGSNGTYW